MNKKGLIAAVVGIIIVLIAGVYYISQRSSKTSNTQVVGNKMVDENSESTGVKSLRELLSLNVSQKCTYTDLQYGSVGTVYVTNGKMRGDFEVTVDGNKMSSHTIVDGETMYVWTDGQNQGYKMTLSQDDETIQGDETASPVTSESIDLDKQVDYNCSVWTVNNSIFSLPSEIEFTDMNAMMESVTGMMQDSQEIESENSEVDKCQYCETLPGEAKTQCLQAFGC